MKADLANNWIMMCLLPYGVAEEHRNKFVARLARILFGEVYPRYYKDLKMRRPTFLYSYKRKVLT